MLHVKTLITSLAIDYSIGGRSAALDQIDFGLV